MAKKWLPSDSIYLWTGEGEFKKPRKIKKRKEFRLTSAFGRRSFKIARRDAR